MLTSDYIIGLVDGEGSFTVHVQNPTSRSKRRARVEPRFFLKLQYKDKLLLDELKKFFRCGNVYIQRDRRKGHKLCYRYEVANRQDLREKIIPFFRCNSLRSYSKKKDFELFCRTMELIDKNEHLREEGLEKIRSIKELMH